MINSKMDLFSRGLGKNFAFLDAGIEGNCRKRGSSKFQNRFKVCWYIISQMFSFCFCFVFLKFEILSCLVPRLPPGLTGKEAEINTVNFLCFCYFLLAIIEITNFLLYRRIFDVKSPESPAYTLNFIKRRLQNVSSSQRQEGLVWLQVRGSLTFISFCQWLNSDFVCRDLVPLFIFIAEAPRAFTIKYLARHGKLVIKPRPKLVSKSLLVN